jgi:hypothetical protein
MLSWKNLQYSSTYEKLEKTCTENLENLRYKNYPGARQQSTGDLTLFWL